jgi:DNA polymerase-3 subunit epsilon
VLAGLACERQRKRVQSSSLHARQPVRETHFVAIDFESAGAGPGQTDHVVQIGLVTCTGLDFSTVETYRTYVKPESEVAWTASRVHGIDAAMVEASPPFRSLWPEVRARMANRVVVAHGAATEKRHLRAFPLHGFGPWVDTLVLARKVWPLAPSHRLGELIGGLGRAEELRKFCPGLHWHDALFDAFGALVLLKAIIDRAGLWDHPTADLVQARLAVPRQTR